MKLDEELFLFKKSKKTYFLVFLFLVFYPDVKYNSIQTKLDIYCQRIQIKKISKVNFNIISGDIKKFFQHFTKESNIELDIFLESLFNFLYIPVSDNFLNVFKSQRNQTLMKFNLMNYHRHFVFSLSSINELSTSNNYLLLISLFIRLYFKMVIITDSNLIKEEEKIQTFLKDLISTSFYPENDHLFRNFTNPLN